MCEFVLGALTVLQKNVMSIPEFKINIKSSKTEYRNAGHIPKWSL